jgi:hypothetical protein
MAVTTTDVVKNVVSGVENIHNGNIVTGCLKTGAYSIQASGSSVIDTSMTYDNLQTKLINKFDSSVSYYNKAPV